MNRSVWKRFGPGMLVTAAFVGPGTITTASKAGASYGTALVWAVFVAVVAAIILQEMAARLGLVTRQGLGEALVAAFPSVIGRWAVLVLVLAAILVGNIAYQAGNLTGAAVGLESLLGGSTPLWIGICGTLAIVLLIYGAYASVQRLLIGLVLLMSVVFVGSAFVSAPNLGPIKGFAMPTSGLPMVLALIGTTVVPYNLFLHARSVQEKWSADEDIATALREARWDTIGSILLGGMITLAILLTAAAAFHSNGVPFESLGQISRQLEPLLGRGAKALFAVGIFAAGMTSTITAPLAAAYAAQGCLGWKGGWKDRRFLGTAVGVVIVGMLIGMTAGRSPQSLILFAQLANGALLPLVAVFLLIVMNQRSVLGAYKNRWGSNILGGLVVILVATLAGWKLWHL